MIVTKERRRIVAAGVFCLLSIGLSALAILIGLFFSTSPNVAWAIRVFGASAALEMTEWQLQFYRTELVALALALLATGLWFIWNPQGLPRSLRLSFLIGVLLVIFAFISPQIVRDVLGIT